MLLGLEDNREPDDSHPRVHYQETGISSEHRTTLPFYDRVCTV